VRSAALVLLAGVAVADPLPAWNDTPAKEAIVAFVGKVVDARVPEAERVAVFDNDGTLWAEQPLYFQLYFAFDRIRALAPQHPEWKGKEPFQAALDGDLERALAGGQEALLELVMASHAGNTTEEFERIVSDWIATAKHPVTGKRFTDMVYQPMLELLAYLRANGFRTYIVSGGGIEFIRPWAHRVYGVPPEQVVGSSVRAKYEVRDGHPVIVRLPEMDFVDDGAGKPVGIHRHIGRRPLAAFGNSDGDFEMLQWTTGGGGPRLGALVRHTDAEREWAYDRESHVGRLGKALDAAPAQGWIVIDMKRDWKTIFPPLGTR
jgi:hypothetical protein